MARTPAACFSTPSALTSSRRYSNEGFTRNRRPNRSAVNAMPAPTPLINGSVSTVVSGSLTADGQRHWGGRESSGMAEVNSRTSLLGERSPREPNAPPTSPCTNRRGCPGMESIPGTEPIPGVISSEREDRERIEQEIVAGGRRARRRTGAECSSTPSSGADAGCSAGTPWHPVERRHRDSERRDPPIELAGLLLLTPGGVGMRESNDRDVDERTEPQSPFLPAGCPGGAGARARFRPGRSPRPDPRDRSLQPGRPRSWAGGRASSEPTSTWFGRRSVGSAMPTLISSARFGSLFPSALA